MVARAQDNNDTWGDYFTFYLTIESNQTPSVKEITSPSPINPLFGDAVGNFTLSGIAQIEDPSPPGENNVRVGRVQVVWIKPIFTAEGEADEDAIAEQQLLYTDRTYKDWDLVSSDTSSASDSMGNKLWEIPAGNIEFIPSTDGNNGTNGQEEYIFKLDLNIFDDLNIGPGKDRFGGQHFLVRVVSNVVQNPLSLVSPYDTMGDVDPPKFTGSVKLTHTRAADSMETEVNDITAEMIPIIASGDKIKVEGTWSDDSLAAWSGVSNISDFFEEKTVTWNGTPMDIEFRTDGTWSAEKTFGEKNNDAIIVIGLSISDWSGNPGIRQETMMVETDNPTLIRISTDTPDGVYGVNKNTGNLAGSTLVDIYLEFNKIVKFVPDADNTGGTREPYLVLNNGGRALYHDGNGTSTRIGFRYDIADGTYGGVDTITDKTGDVPRLHVTEIARNGNGKWVSVDGGSDAVMNNPGVGSSLSLAGGKNIVIDKTAPKINTFVSSMDDTRRYGKDSPVYINVTFNETIRVVSGSGAVLELKGGNLATHSAKAQYLGVSGASTLSFMYTVGAGHDTSHFDDELGVKSFTAGSLVITDQAGNVLDDALASAVDANARQGKLNSSLIVDTHAPKTPLIENIEAQSYYETPSFKITGLESADVTVEYSLDYDHTDPGKAAWTSYTGTITGTEADAYQTGDIPIPVNGDSYYIAARQYDNALTTQNVSANPAQGQVVGPVKVDKGELLLRLGSDDTADGIYADDSETDLFIDLNFRIPVYLDVTPAGSNGPRLTLNLEGNGTRYAYLPVSDYHSADYKTWTFKYTLVPGDHAELLDVEAVDLNGAHFTDAGSTEVNSWINLDKVSEENLLRNQKNITVLTGKPTPLGIAFDDEGGDPSLIITFDRDIYKGSGDVFVTIEQLSGDYRVPAVLSEAQFGEFFFGPDGTLGDEYYYRGTNGFNYTGQGDAKGSADTTAKYILRYDFDSTNYDSTGSGTGKIREHIRKKEIIRLPVTSSLVKIDIAQPKVLTLVLKDSFALPAKGAKYNYKLDEGYVVDFLGKENDELKSYNGDPDLDDTSGGTGLAKTIVFPGVEKPVIRINKQNETLTGTTELTRQAHQPATTGMKIDCRTPGAAIYYATEVENHPVGPIIKRGTTGQFVNLADNGYDSNWPLRISSGGVEYDPVLPTIGVRETSDTLTGFTTNDNYTTGMEALQKVRMAAEEVRQRQPKIPVPAKAAPNNLYSEAVTLGSPNYALGGMKYMITAEGRKSVETSEESQEVAYRSVFVFVNNGSRGNANTLDVGANFTQGVQRNLSRLWVRGGDQVDGGVLTPDFPVSRDLSQWGMARLMTPINFAYNNTNFSDVDEVLTESNIQGNYNTNGGYLWFWITWKLNDTPAYVDVIRGSLGNTTNTYPVNSSYTTSAYTPYKAMFPVTPGDTRVIETRVMYQRPNDGNDWVIQNSSKGAIGWIVDIDDVPSPRTD
jgi:hypothetical protein